MEKPKFLYCFLILCCIVEFSCSQSSKKSEDGLLKNNDIYVIDVDNAIREEIHLSHYFNAPKTIIRETTKKSLIGEIDAMQVTDEYIFILDEDVSKGVLVFNKEGKFIRKIGNRGKGPGEYKNISDFTLDVLNEEIYLMDAERKLVHKYNYKTGLFVNTLSLKSEGIYFSHIQYWNGKLYTDAVYPRREQTDKYVIQELDKNTGEQIKTWLDGDVYNKGANMSMYKDESFFYNRTYGEPKYFQMYMDTVLCLTSEGLYPYLMIQDRNWVTHEDVKEGKETPSKPISALIYEKKKAYNISNYIECGDLIYFNYRTDSKSTHIVYDKRNRMYRITDHIENNYCFTKNWLGKLGCADDKGIYEYKDSRELSSYFIKILKTEHGNTELDKYNELIKLDEEYINPIIFYYERK